MTLLRGALLPAMCPLPTVWAEDEAGQNQVAGMNGDGAL